MRASGAASSCVQSFGSGNLGDAGLTNQRGPMEQASVSNWALAFSFQGISGHENRQLIWIGSDGPARGWPTAGAARFGK